MIQCAQGSLVIIDLTTVWWKGQKVEGVEAVMVHADDDSQTVKLRVSGDQTALHADMEAAGIRIRRVK